MNGSPIQFSRATSAGRLATRRTVAKQITRVNIMSSARSLFAEKGYEGTTLREIAAAAHVSTGAVFDNFAGKYDLFAEIVDVDLKTLYDAMCAAMVGETANETLRFMFDAGCRFVLQNLKLMQSILSVSWSPEHGAELRSRVAQWPIADLFTRVLDEAVERGELARQTNTRLISQILLDIFLANFSHAAFSGWNHNELMVRYMNQILVLMNEQQKDNVKSLSESDEVGVDDVDDRYNLSKAQVFRSCRDARPSGFAQVVVDDLAGQDVSEALDGAIEIDVAGVWVRISRSAEVQMAVAVVSALRVRQ